MTHIKIIAEIGENHIGDMKIACDLIAQAASAGADYVKFQSYRPETFRPDDPEYDWFKKVSLTDDAHFFLKEEAVKNGINFLSSPFSVERAAFLCEHLREKEIKIASGMMLSFPVLDYVNQHAETVFLSTGLATLSEIKLALSHLQDVKKCYILHCTTQYPCQDTDANLRAITGLQEEFPDYEIGYSDHTIGYLASLAAAAMGAAVIEKHYTFDREAEEGTDHEISVEPEELRSMVKDIRRIETLMGDSKKTPTDSEKEIAEFVRGRFIAE